MKKVKCFAVGTILIEEAVIIKEIRIVYFFFQNGLKIVAVQVRREKVVIFCRKIQPFVVNVEIREL